MKREARRPYVICHMAPSVDGRIVADKWKNLSRVVTAYESTARTFGADAWMIGRVSMEPYAGKATVPRRKGRAATIPRKDFVAPHDAATYVVALDPSGKLTWRSSAIDGEHVVTVLSERVSDDYLAFLQAKGVSYVFGGKTDVSLKRALAKLGALFGIKRLLLEGGGKINGSFLAEGLVDELSLVVVPIADGSTGTAALFDAGPKGPLRPLKLMSVQKRPGDLLWLRYKVM